MVVAQASNVANIRATARRVLVADRTSVKLMAEASDVSTLVAV
jgi:nicotinate-nucleotide pyrophosphorylase